MSDQEDADLAVVEIDLANASDIPARALDANQLQGDWQSVRETCPFIVAGFPNQHSFVDYDTGEIWEGYVELTAQYLRPDATGRTHWLTILDPPPLESFSGLSGSPVFLVRHDVGAPSRLLLCGMAIQGAIESRLVHFIGAEAVLDMVKAKINRGPPR
jgi:hypothetical protein